MQIRPCSCPHPDCNYVGLPKSLYTHFAAQHSRSSTQFRFNYGFPISLDNSQTHVFLQEKTESILFILNRSFEPLGSFVNVMCIAPTSFKREFSYELTAKDGFSSIKLKTIAESTPQWITQPPVKKCVLVPNDFITSAGQLKLEVTIWKERESPISSSRCSSLLQTPK
ncbi:UNVERIFIED_CONTAM: E3 ubiquitin-protein ligase SINA-like 1 [Sesamum calycinum]|uniref:E3 ubiquitin-protein ligase SINA-like 1 n=1 Tax=Sesamum calycinum TaxID=2727403 RepID=A0AAW2SU15_9LAMI